MIVLLVLSDCRLRLFIKNVLMNTITTIIVNQHLYQKCNVSPCLVWTSTVSLQTALWTTFYLKSCNLILTVFKIILVKEVLFAAINKVVTQCSSLILSIAWQPHDVIKGDHKQHNLTDCFFFACFLDSYICKKLDNGTSNYQTWKLI